MVTRLIETLGRQAAKKGEYKYFKTLIQRQRQNFFDKWQVRHTGEVFGRNLLRISDSSRTKKPRDIRLVCSPNRLSKFPAIINLLSNYLQSRL